MDRPWLKRHEAASLRQRTSGRTGTRRPKSMLLGLAPGTPEADRPDGSADGTNWGLRWLRRRSSVRFLSLGQFSM